MRSNCDKFYCVNENSRPRGHYLTIFVVLSLLVPPFLRPSADTSGGGRGISEYAYGLTLESESHGSALGAFYSFFFTSSVRGLVQGKVLNVAEGLPVVDAWTGRIYETGGTNLVLVPIVAGITYHPFEGRIANNFSPLVAVGLGPTLILNLAEEGGFFDQWRNVETRFYGGAFAGAGVEIPIRARSFMTIILGYDFLPMGRSVDGREHYSGTVLKFMFGRSSRR